MGIGSALVGFLWITGFRALVVSNEYDVSLRWMLFGRRLGCLKFELLIG